VELLIIFPFKKPEVIQIKAESYCKHVFIMKIVCCRTDSPGKSKNRFIFEFEYGFPCTTRNGKPNPTLPPYSLSCSPLIIKLIITNVSANTILNSACITVIRKFIRDIFCSDKKFRVSAAYPVEPELLKLTT